MMVSISLPGPLVETCFVERPNRFLLHCTASTAGEHRAAGERASSGNEDCMSTRTNPSPSITLLQVRTWSTRCPRKKTPRSPPPTPCCRPTPRGRPARLRRAPRRQDVAIDLRRLTPPSAEAGDSWVTVETLEGVGADVVVVGEVLVSAAMATRGFDPASLSAADVRIETSSDIDGSQVTRFLVHSRALSGRNGT